ncbi:MAG: hypothetical protein ACOX8W_10530 [bacterium]
MAKNKDNNKSGSKGNLTGRSGLNARGATNRSALDYEFGREFGGMAGENAGYSAKKSPGATGTNKAKTDKYSQ